MQFDQEGNATRKVRKSLPLAAQICLLSTSNSFNYRNEPVVAPPTGVWLSFLSDHQDKVFGGMQAIEFLIQLVGWATFIC
jgi:hypothetical protein